MGPIIKFDQSAEKLMRAKNAANLFSTSAINDEHAHEQNASEKTAEEQQKNWKASDENEWCLNKKAFADEWNEMNAWQRQNDWNE